MVTIDQLRISDDGQAMFINAHVNKASYFDNVYLKRITICTEEQVSETNSQSYGSDFIYQVELSSLSSTVLKQTYEKTQILSEKKLLDRENVRDGWTIFYTPLPDAAHNYLSLVFSGKFSVMDTGFAPKLVITNHVFNPAEHYLNNENILFTIDGNNFEDKGHRVWQFKGKGEIGDGSQFCCYLYKQTSQGVYEYVPLEETDDENFLHFLWQIYGEYEETTSKELHLVLGKNDFNEKFIASDLSHNMFFVYIECDGIPDSSVPCRLDEMTTLGVTFDYGTIFNPAMSYARELADSCQIPHNFINFILNYDALKLAVETEHYVPAIEHWRWLMNNTSGKTAGYSGTKPCGCHG